MKRIHELFGIRTRVLTVSGQRGNKAGKPDTQKSVSFCRGGRPIRSEISFFPLDGRSSTTSSRARDSNESGCRTNCRCRYCYFPDGMPVSVTLPRLHSNQSQVSKQRKRDSTESPPFRISRSKRIVRAYESRRRTYSTPFSSGILN